MKKAALYFVFILFTLIVALSFTSFEINEKIEIDASKEEVWNTIIDFDNYAQWNSQLAYLGGAVEPNGKLHLKLSAEGTDPYEFKPDISYWEENTKFAWIAITGVPRVFDGEHFFELEETADGKTLVTNRRRVQRNTFAYHQKLTNDEKRSARF